MTQKLYEEAYKEADKELNNAKIELFKREVKAFKQEQLEQQEKYKRLKEDCEDKLRIIKLNLDNLDNGKFEAIQERIEKSQTAKSLSTNTAIWTTFNGMSGTNLPWNYSWGGGTYTVGGKIYYF